MDLLNSYWPWIVGIGSGGLFAAASWFLGLGTLLRILATLMEVLGPIVRALVEFVIEWIKWCFVGLLDVLDNMKTTVFVLTIVGAMAVGCWWHEGTLRKEYNAVILENVELQKQLQKKAQKPKGPAPKAAEKKEFDLWKFLSTALD